MDRIREPLWHTLLLLYRCLKSTLRHQDHFPGLGGSTSITPRLCLCSKIPAKDYYETGTGVRTICNIQGVTPTFTSYIRQSYTFRCIFRTTLVQHRSRVASSLFGSGTLGRHG